MGFPLFFVITFVESAITERVDQTNFCESLRIRMLCADNRRWNRTITPIALRQDVHQKAAKVATRVERATNRTAIDRSTTELYNRELWLDSNQRQTDS